MSGFTSTSVQPLDADLSAIAALTTTAFGRGLLDDADASESRTNLGITTGTYTPTLTDVTNIALSSPLVCIWERIGNHVTVSGGVNVTPTAADAATNLGISLPIASNLSGGSTDCAGNAVSQSIKSECAAIIGDNSNDRARMLWVTTTTTANNMWFKFTYLIN